MKSIADMTREELENSVKSLLAEYIPAAAKAEISDVFYDYRTGEISIKV